MVYKIQEGSKLHLWLIAHVTYQSLNVENVIEVGRYLYLEINKKKDMMINVMNAYG